jgi:hypothetical protein
MSTQVQQNIHSDVPKRNSKMKGKNYKIFFSVILEKLTNFMILNNFK